MIQLNTERLTIEKASLKDAFFFLTLFNSPNIIEFIGDKGLRTLKNSEEYIKNNIINSYETNGYGLYKMSLKENKKPIGICGFVKRNYLDSADIGFGILPEYEGKGYTFEALKAIMDYGKLILRLNPVLAITSKKNIKSQHLLNKIGLFKKSTIKPEAIEILLYSNVIQ